MSLYRVLLTLIETYFTCATWTLMTRACIAWPVALLLNETGTSFPLHSRYTWPRQVAAVTNYYRGFSSINAGQIYRHPGAYLHCETV
ncbi:hypothetical protein BDR04DRAFT_573941 [Suillus decipiens]|nr:hypothetical protein BDR04DRAFT_573941 [Suillus decipiens]